MHRIKHHRVTDMPPIVLSKKLLCLLYVPRSVEACKVFVLKSCFHLRLSRRVCILVTTQVTLRYMYTSITMGIGHIFMSPCSQAQPRAVLDHVDPFPNPFWSRADQCRTVLSTLVSRTVLDFPRCSATEHIIMTTLMSIITVTIPLWSKQRQDTTSLGSSVVWSSHFNPVHWKRLTRDHTLDLSCVYSSYTWSRTIVS